MKKLAGLVLLIFAWFCQPAHAQQSNLYCFNPNWTSALNQWLPCSSTNPLSTTASVTANTSFTAASSLPTLSAGAGAAGYESLGGAPYVQPVFGSASGGGTQVDATHGLPVNVITNIATPAGTNLIGYTSGDPCTQKSKKSVAFSTGTSGTQLFAGTASTNTYICSLSVITSAAANFSIVVGSGSSVCTGGTPLALIGSTTASSGLALPANGGLTFGNGGATVVNDLGAVAQGYNVCIGINGTATLAGSLSYVQQ